VTLDLLLHYKDRILVWAETDGGIFEINRKTG